MVGFLGEKNQANWWMSNFINRSSDAFLLPIYPRTTLLAQYHGVCEAALLVHDEHIGVGNTYHLYRLPNSIERVVAESIRDNSGSATLKDKLSDKDAALTALQAFAHTTVEKAEGPVAIGVFQDAALENLLAVSAAHYLQAFRENYQCFPYMRQA
ncbi:BrxE family protein [Candidatus Thiothrix anitrata]|uniref:BrxE family protein n=1 Tax=Candidatus Thiothrix anitrata TaxID=2823902 RepID=A0ABX7X0M0_9GAMM|nr:BrxE family protein [Candidatus Thiothrix anitrata]